MTPQTMFMFFFAINVHGSTRYSKNGIPDQIDRIYTLFQNQMAKSIPYLRLEMLKSDTLWGGTYLYGLYMGVPPILQIYSLLKLLAHYIAQTQSYLTHFLCYKASSRHGLEPIKACIVVYSIALQLLELCSALCDWEIHKYIKGC